MNEKLALPLTICALLLVGIGCMLTGLFHIKTAAGIVLLVVGFFAGASSLLLLSIAGRERYG